MACNLEKGPDNGYLDYPEKESVATWGHHPRKSKFLRGSQRSDQRSEVGAPTTVVEMFVTELASDVGKQPLQACGLWARHLLL